MLFFKKIIFSILTFLFLSSANIFAQSDSLLFDNTSISLTNADLNMGGLWQNVFQYYHNLIVAVHSKPILINSLDNYIVSTLQAIPEQLDPTISAAFLNFFETGQTYLKASNPTPNPILREDWNSAIVPLVSIILDASNQNSQRIRADLISFFRNMVDAVNKQLIAYISPKHEEWELYTNLANCQAEQTGIYLSMLFPHSTDHPSVNVTNANLEMGALWEEIFQYYHDWIIATISNRELQLPLAENVLMTFNKISNQFDRNNANFRQIFFIFLTTGSNFIQNIATFDQWKSTIEPLVSSLLVASKNQNNESLSSELKREFEIMVIAVNEQLKAYTTPNHEGWSPNTALANCQAEQTGIFLSTLFN